MAELMDKSQAGFSIGVQKSPRFRFSQARASKRSIVEYKRGSNRTHKGQKSENNNPDRTILPKHQTRGGSADHIRSGQRSPLDSTSGISSSPDSSPDSEPLSPTVSSATSTEHKRPRPEVQLSPNDLIPNLSSSAPPGCMIESCSSTLLFDTHRTDLPARDRSRQFFCSPSLLNEHRLQYLLSRESLYHPNNAFLYYVNPEVEDKVDASLRNDAVHNLRFIHNAFFNLSTETFCKAINLIDRFIVKVKVKPKYMACVATAAYCAASKLCRSNKEADLPDLDTLVHITRCGGNAADLVRMEEILASKLSHDLDGVNAFDFLQVFVDSVLATTSTMPESSTTDSSSSCADGDHPPFELDCSSSPIAEPGDQGAEEKAVDETTPLGTVKATHTTSPPSLLKNSRRAKWTQLVKRLMTRLEITLCSLEAYRFRPACLALGILAQMNVKGLMPLANMCGIDWTEVISCASLVEELYEIYYRDPLPYVRRPLVWTLSRRTLLRIGYSSPTPLDTITEDCEPTEEEDWLLPLLFEP